MTTLQKIKLLDQKRIELENKKNKLLEKRKYEIASIIEKTKTLHLDDMLITGAFLALKEIIENNTEAEIEKLKKLASNFYMKNPPKQQLKK